MIGTKSFVGPRGSRWAWPTARDFLLYRGSDRDALEEAFFRSIMLPNGTFKSTCEKRLDDLNEFVAPFLASLHSNPVRVIDVAFSSGVSTAEWAKDVAARGIPLKYREPTY